jgi:hypothetical protein
LILPERYFYHSFPRRFTGKPEEELKKGLEILRAMRDFGLVLTPEITNWQECLANGSLGPPWTVIQKRCSFTELGPSELRAHCEQFGHFSIEFSPLEFRKLGGIPVFYVPRSVTSGSGPDSLGSAMLARIGEIQRMLSRLVALSGLIANTNDKTQFVGIEQQGAGKSFSRASLGAAEDIIALLTAGSQPAEALENALRLFAGFFHPTEDERFTGPLGYYRQREWRLLANIRGLTDCAPTAEMVDRLLSIDGDFFGKEMAFFTGLRRRADECRLFPQLDGKAILSYASRIVVPKDAVAEASSLLSGIRGPRVITLDELA